MLSLLTFTADLSWFIFSRPLPSDTWLHYKILKKILPPSSANHTDGLDHPTLFGQGRTSLHCSAPCWGLSCPPLTHIRSIRLCKCNSVAPHQKVCENWHGAWTPEVNENKRWFYSHGDVFLLSTYLVETGQ